MMEELKRCPFCGAPAQLKEITGRWAVEYSMTSRNQSKCGT